MVPVSRQRQLERLEQAIKATGLGIWDWDIPSGRVEINDLWYAMLEEKPSSDETTFDDWATRVHPDDVKAATRALTAHLNGARIDKADMRGVHVVSAQLRGTTGKPSTAPPVMAENLERCES